MKDIGILTYYYHNCNFGGQLQAYALQSVLQKMGYSVEQICYSSNNNDAFYCLKGVQKIIHLFNSPAEVIINKFVNPKIYKHLKGRFDSFLNFQLSIPHSEKIYNDDNISEANLEYKIFVCGSDQIWKDWGFNSDQEKKNYLLSFVEDNRKRIAYAASLGANYISDDYARMFRNELARFNAISVRENSGKFVLQPLTDVSIKVVADPVLLLHKSEWESLAVEPNLKEEYIFCYFLGTNQQHRKYAIQFAKKTKCKIVTLPYAAHNRFSKCDFMFGDIRDMSAGPKEFLGYIKNSKYVLTDSFHAMVFSTIFHRQFFVFFRENGKNTMNGRIQDYLNVIGLEDRLVDLDIPVISKEINYYGVENIINDLRNKSLEFLHNSL